MEMTGRGTLYQYFQVLGGKGEPERAMFVKWIDAIGTFEELVVLIGRPAYELKLDDRPPQDFRVAKPGWAVMGKKHSGLLGEHAMMVGVFVPQGAEAVVAEQLTHDFGSVAFIPWTLRELSQLAPSTLLTAGI